MPASPPVLSLTEAAEHPHNTARGTFRRGSYGGREPAPAQRFGATPAGEPRPVPVVGAHTSEILARATGLTQEDIETLREKGIVG
ncbi:hypothetical protein [Streptomyces sp. NBC_00063]|uniref:hypothetical protein n=1 Tax=Streptomyces sp. NBC_00063 TaxID=2975638 RepID=UPI003D75FC9A